MSQSSPPPGRRRGVLTRALRRLLLALLREEMEEMRRGLALHQGAIDAQRAELDGQRAELDGQRAELEAHRSTLEQQRADLGEYRRSLVSLDARVEAVERDTGAQAAALETLRGEVAARSSAADTARLALQDHLETQIGQVVAEVAELRQVLLTVRGEFEAVRDGRVPQLEGAASRLHQAVVAVQSGVEELGAVRVARLEAGAAETAAALAALQSHVETVDAVRLPRLEEDAQRISEALQLVQGALEDLSAVRVAQLEGDATRLASHLREVQAAVEAVRDRVVAQIQAELSQLSEAARELQRELERLRDEAVPATARAVAALQAGWDELQGEVLSLRDHQLPRVAEGLAALQRGVCEVQRLGEEVRDERLPALAARSDALLARLHERLEETAGLLDRLLAGEGLRIDTPAAVEAALPEALRRAHLAFLDTFRGGREETLARVGEHVARLAGHEPVLDLGCGRGELLEALLQAGIEARGVDADPAMVEACRRRGLAVIAGDALEVLGQQPPASLGAVTALHLFEHLPAGTWASLIQAAAAALREGGVLLVECPNPEALRVGANLFWIDPTHRVPVHREAAAFVMRALGLQVVENTLVHPFPPEQKLAHAELPAELRGLAARLDDLLSAPRDWLLVARKPTVSPA